MYTGPVTLLDLDYELTMLDCNFSTKKIIWHREWFIVKVEATVWSYRCGHIPDYQIDNFIDVENRSIYHK